ncbi:Histone H2B.3, partial [Atta colombica]
RRAQKNISSSENRQEEETQEEEELCYLTTSVKISPDTGISSKAMSIMNSFVNVFERIKTINTTIRYSPHSFDYHDLVMSGPNGATFFLRNETQRPLMPQLPSGSGVTLRAG